MCLLKLRSDLYFTARIVWVRRQSDSNDFPLRWAGHVLRISNFSGKEKGAT